MSVLQGVAQQVQSAIDRVLNEGRSQLENYELLKVSLPCDNLPEKLGILNDYEHIIIVQQFDANKPSKSSNSVEEKTASQDNVFNSSMSDGNDIIGSPLKMLAIADLSAEVSSDSVLTRKSLTNIYSPLTARQARHFLSLVSIARARLNDCEFDLDCPILALCDGIGMDGLVFIAYEVIPLDGTAQRITSGTVSGPFSMSRASAMIDLNIRGEVSCYALYNIIDRLNDDCPFANLPGSLKIEVEWDKMTGVFAAPPNDISTAVTVSVVPSGGDRNSPVYTLFEELSYIERLINAAESREMMWGCHTSDNSISVFEALKLCLAEFKSGDAFVERVGEKEVNDEKVDVLRVQKRSDYDFTDYLWNILHQSGSYSQLEQCFQIIFKELKSGELQPLVNIHNNTTMAQVVKESFSGRFFIPTFLSMRKTFDLLIEMGLQKLNHDYVAILISNDLATLDEVSSYIRSDEDIPTWFSYLQKLHHTLEVVFLLDTYLKLPHDTAVSCVRQIFKLFKNNDFDCHATFKVTIPISNITTLLERSSPSVWSCTTVNSVVGEYTESSVVRLSIDSPVPHIDPARASDVSITDVHDYFALNVKQNIIRVA